MNVSCYTTGLHKNFTGLTPVTAWDLKRSSIMKFQETLAAKDLVPMKYDAQLLASNIIAISVRNSSEMLLRQHIILELDFIFSHWGWRTLGQTFG